MTLETLYHVGQTVGVLFVIATLVALVVQGRQANMIARAELTQGVFTRLVLDTLNVWIRWKKPISWNVPLIMPPS